MNASAINDLHYKWYLKILSKLHETLVNLKEFFKYYHEKVTSLIAQAFIWLLIYYCMTTKIMKSHVLIGTTVQMKNKPQIWLLSVNHNKVIFSDCYITKNYCYSIV